MQREIIWHRFEDEKPTADLKYLIAFRQIKNNRMVKGVEIAQYSKIDRSFMFISDKIVDYWAEIYHPE